MMFDHPTRSIFPFIALALAGCTTIHSAATDPDRIGAKREATIFIASDSTAADYPPSKYPQAGWGSYLGCELRNVRISNQAIGGRSTRTFIEEGRWNRLRQGISPGDFVLIQFAHNDANTAKAERYAAPQTSYRQNLLSFVLDVRNAGGTPVLVTPVARRSFSEGAAKADFAEYSAVVRTLASEFDVALIDLEADSRQLLTSLGPDASKALYLHYPKGQFSVFPDGIADDTHFSERGARRMAGLVAKRLALTYPALAKRTSSQGTSTPGLEKCG